MTVVMVRPARRHVERDGVPLLGLAVARAHLAPVEHRQAQLDVVLVGPLPRVDREAHPLLAVLLERPRGRRRGSTTTARRCRSWPSPSRRRPAGGRPTRASRRRPSRAVPGCRRVGRHRAILAGGPRGRDVLVWLPMKLAILSRAPRSYSTQRLRTAAVDRGHDVKVLNTLRFGIDLTGDEPDLLFRGKQLSTYDAVLPRIGNSITYFGTAVVRQFEQMDVYTPNTVLRHRQQPRQAARDADPVAPRDPDAGDDLRARPRRRDPRDRARRRCAGRDQAARGHAGHRRDPGADASRSPRRSSRRCRAPGRTC